MHPSRPLFHTAGSVGPFQSSTSSSSSNFQSPSPSQSHSPFAFHPQGKQFHLPTTSSSFIPFHDSSQRTMFGMVQGEGSQYRSTSGVWSSSGSSSSTTFNPLRQDSMYQPRAIDLQHGVASSMHKADWYTATSDESSYSPEPESTQSTALIRSKMLELPTFYPNQAFTASNATSAAFHDDPSPSLKQLSLTPSHEPSSSTLGRGEMVRHHHLGSLLVSVPAALSLDLPLMPIFLESTNFSCRNVHLTAPKSVHDDPLVGSSESQCTPAQAWSHVQECLKKTGTLTAQPKQFQLSCSTTVGTSTVDFNVRCYRGHYRSCAPPAVLGGESSSDSSAASGADEWFTFEFQRQSGCCVTTWQLFKHVLRSFIDTFGEKSIECAVTVDKKDQFIEADVDGPGHGQSVEDDGEGSSSMNETDLAAAGLSIPSLIPSLSVPQLKRSCSVEGAPAKSLEDDDTFCTSLLDMLTSSCESSQLDGLNALACYLDDAASNSLSSTLLCEVARKLQSSADCHANMTVAASPCVQRIATSILERASQMPTLAGQVSQHCLPSILASLREQQSNVSQSDAQRCIQSAHRLSTQKNLLRSCINLSGACNTSFDMEGGPIAHSQLKRQLLRMTSHSDDEVRGLATETIRAISV